MHKDKLSQIANKLVRPKRGIFAADWSMGSTEKHFTKNKIEHTEENRRKYRQLLLSTPELENYISGVILYDETFWQKTDDGDTFPKYLEKRDIIPGVKVDKGTKDMENFPGEKITDGLDGLRERLEAYAKSGAMFTKWRAAIKIGKDIPTEACIESNTESMARFAALSQEAGLVPIVEPEDLMEGDHSLLRSAEVTKRVLAAVFSALEKHKVYLEGVVLKTSSVHPGTESKERVNYQKVAEETFKALERTVPPAVAGVVFLSGGDLPVESTRHLNEIIKISKKKSDVAWELSFSYARALQYPAISIWAGKDDNIKKAQKEFIKRVKLTSLARQGKYRVEMEKQ